MKTFLKTLFILVIIAGVVSSCTSPVKITGNGKKEDIKKMKRAAMLEFIIAPHFKPTFPLIDAAIFNSNLDDIALGVMKMNSEKANEFETYFAEKYIKYSGNDILYGSEFYKSDEYKKIAEFLDVQTIDYDDEDFPEIAIPRDAKNYFDFYDTENPLYYFDNKRLSVLKPYLTKIARALQVDGLVIVVTGISVESGGFSLERVSVTKIIFYNDINEKFVILTSSTDPVYGKTASIDNYKNALDQYLTFSDFMLQVLFDLKPNEWDAVN